MYVYRFGVLTVKILRMAGEIYPVPELAAPFLECRKVCAGGMIPHLRRAVLIQQGRVYSLTGRKTFVETLDKFKNICYSVFGSRFTFC